MALMQTLQSRQVGFHSLVEAIDTTTAIGQFFFQITGAFAELERNLMRERTRAGLARVLSQSCFFESLGVGKSLNS